MGAISAASLKIIAEMTTQDITNTLWSFAFLREKDMPLIIALSAASLNRIEIDGSVLNRGMLLWTLWRFGWSLGQCYLDWQDSDLSEETLGLYLMENSWKRGIGEWQLLARVHEASPVFTVFVAAARLGPSLKPPMTIQPSLQKLSKLVDALDAVSAGGALELLAECDDFARYRGQWLKVAGMDKAEVLLASLSRVPTTHAVEFGVYVGYTAVRLSHHLHPHLGLFSLEVSPVNVCTARHVLDLAHLSHIGEVKHGLAKDVLGIAGEELGERSMSFSFMDHRGTVFHLDFSLLQLLHHFAPGAELVADNTLNPGAPLFVWLCHTRLEAERHRFIPWSVMEFQATHEDWTSVFTSL